MGVSVWQLAIVAVLILVLFGRGRISEMMGDFGKGISSFKKGMTEEERETPAPSSPQIEAPAPTAAAAPETTESATDKPAS